MSFWDDRLGPPKKAQPAQPVAPGNWWQTPAQQAQIAQPQIHSDGQGAVEYTPASSQFVRSRLSHDVDDICPRCGSYEYVKIAAESAAGSTYALPGARLRCMDCNYPGIDTSEGVIGSIKGTSAAVPIGGHSEVVTHKVRERGGRNKNSFSGFNESSQAEGSTVLRIM